MKTKFLFLTLIAMTSLCIAQNNYNGLTLIPDGKILLNDDNLVKNQEFTVTLRSYLISNEITNKEFREFVAYAKANPEKKLEWVELKPDVKIKDRKAHITYLYYKDILKNIIDTLSLAKEFPLKSKEYQQYKNYFSDKKYDNYPVVGVTNEGARLYCIWRTHTENNELEIKGKPRELSYRLPTMPEWYFAKTFNPKLSNEKACTIESVMRQKVKSKEVANMHGNVSEWISTVNENKEIVALGLSWKDTESNESKSFSDTSTKTGYIGFRIVKDVINN